jgi:hypothetical protein
LIAVTIFLLPRFGALHPHLLLDGRRCTCGGGGSLTTRRPAEFLPAALGHRITSNGEAPCSRRCDLGIGPADFLTWDASTATLQPSARPNALGRFGPFGGQYVPETLMPALAELEAAAAEAWKDPAFTSRLDHLLAPTWVGPRRSTRRSG